MSEQQQTVLVVDDDPDIVVVLQAMLEDAGYEVATSEDGRAIEHIDEHKLPQLIILDMFLSGKDGREFARYLKQRETTRSIPLLMISAHPTAAQEAHLAGADDFIAKPFEVDELLEKVAHYLL